MVKSSQKLYPWNNPYTPRFHSGLAACFILHCWLWFCVLSSGFCLIFVRVFLVFFCLFGVSDYSVREKYLYANILHRYFLQFTPPPRHTGVMGLPSIFILHTGVMGCGTAEATGLGFVCFVVNNPRVLSANRVDLGFFVYSAPPSHQTRSTSAGRMANLQWCSD